MKKTTHNIMVTEDVHTKLHEMKCTGRFRAVDDVLREMLGLEAIRELATDPVAYDPKLKGRSRWPFSRMKVGETARFPMQNIDERGGLYRGQYALSSCKYRLKYTFDNHIENNPNEADYTWIVTRTG